MDHENYGKSGRTSGNSDIASGAQDLKTAMEVVERETGRQKAHFMGESSGALRAGLFATLEPERVDRLVLAAFTYKGTESPTLKKRAEQVEHFRTHNMRKRDRAMIESIFTRDKAGTTNPAVGKILADVELQFGDQAPTGTYLDMTANLPVVDPGKVQAPVLLVRGEYDGIATVEDLFDFYRQLPHGDKQLVIFPNTATFSGDRYQPPPVLAHRAQHSRHAGTGSDLKLGGEKIAQRGRCFDRRLIGQVVSRRDRLCANNIGCVSPPDLGRAGLAVAADAAVRAPQEEHGTFDLAPGFKIPGIHFKIDPCCCTIVLADRVNGRRITEAPLVFCQGFRIEKAQTLFGFCELLFDEPVGISAHHSLGQVVRLDIEEPVPGERRPSLVDVVVKVMLRNDVEDRRASDFFGMIEAHSM